MVQYRIKGSGTAPSYLEILQERTGGFDVLITKEYENCLKQTSEFLSRTLFETCIRTGYLTAVETGITRKTA